MKNTDKQFEYVTVDLILNIEWLRKRHNLFLDAVYHGKPLSMKEHSQELTGILYILDQISDSLNQERPIS